MSEFHTDSGSTTGAGQLIETITDTTVSPSRTTTFTYDNHDRITNIDIEEYSVHQDMDYTYTGDSNLIATYIVDGDSNTTVTYTYHDNGSVDTIETPQGSYDYDYTYNLNGAVTNLAYPDGSSAEYAYDNQSRITAIHNKNASSGTISKYACVLGMYLKDRRQPY